MQKLNLRQFLSSLFAFDESQLDAEEKAFFARWVRNMDEQFAAFAMLIAGIYFSFTAIFIPFTVPDVFVVYAMVMNCGIVAAVLIVGYAKIKRNFRVTPIVFSVQLIGGILITDYFIRALQIEFDTDKRWIILDSTCAVLGILVLACPSQRHGWKLAAAFYVSILAGALAWTKASFAFCVVASVFMVVFTFSKNLITTFVKRIAVKDYKIEHYARIAERQKFAHELALARKIQDSHIVPAEIDAGFGVHISTYHKRHSQVGGDWAAVHVFPNGRTIIAVADAAGKGMQAALVIHAVQSLWAHSLSTDTFEPEGWIRAVNRTLLTLGQREPHAVTLGIIDTRNGEATYWSAGHIPIFLMRPGKVPGGEQADVKTIVGFGSMLGIGPEMELRPTAFSFSGEQGCVVMFGTDGVFSNGTRQPKRDTLRLYADVRAEGEEALLRHGADDDKILVLISKGLARNGDGKVGV